MTDAPALPAHPDARTPVLLYDGECGFCAGSVQLVLSLEPAAARARLRFAPLQGRYGTALFAQHPEMRLVDSVLWHDPARNAVLTRSAAALAVLRHLGGAWSLLAALAQLIPRSVRDWLYDRIAQRRLSLAAPSCLLPTPEQRLRFLD